MLNKTSGTITANMLQIEAAETTPLDFRSGSPFTLGEHVKMRFPASPDSVKIKLAMPRDNPSSITTASFFQKFELDSAEFRDSPVAQNNAGLACMEQKEFDKALISFKNALLLEPDFYAAKMNLARAYVSMEQYEHALSIYEEILLDAAYEEPALMAIAHINLLRRRFREAEDALSRVIKGNKENAAAYNNRSVLKMIAGKFADAVKDLRAALSIQPNSIGAHNNLGVSFLSLGAKRKAIRHFKIALSIDTGCRNAIRNLANLLQEEKRYVEAIELLEHYLDRKPQDVSSRELLARSFFFLGKYDHSRKHIKYAIDAIEQRDPKEDKRAELKRFCSNMGATYHMEGDSRNALGWYEKALKDSHRPSQTLYQNVIQLHLDGQRMKLAKHYLDEAIASYPESSTLLLLLSRYHFETGNIKDSLDAGQEALKKDPSSASAYAFLSYIYAESMEDYDEAIKILEEGLLHCKRSPALLNNLAYNCLMKGDTAKARKFLESIESSSLTPDVDGIERDICLTATRGLLLLKEGNLQEGTSLYNRAAQFAKNNRPLQQKVIQKRDLEIGRYHITHGEKEKAIKSLKNVLSSKCYSEYSRQAESLLSKLQRE